MKPQKSIWISLLLMVLAGCTTDRNDRLLTDAEACMETQADSARGLLAQMDTVLTERQQARYALLWTQATHKCRIPLENDSLINVAVEYYSRVGDAHLLAKSLLYKGLVHKQNGEIELAAEAFVSSEQTFTGVEDDQYKALLFNHYASLLAKQSLYNDALTYYKKSYHCKLRGDSIHYVVSACSQIARMYEIINKKDSAEIYYKRGMHYADNTSRKEYLYALLQNYAAFLVSDKRFEEAERLLQENQSQMTDSTYIYNVYAAFATLYYETGDYVKARVYGERMLESNDSLVQCGGMLHLYRIHRQLGDMQTATRYHDLYRQYDSDLTLRKKTAEVAEIPHKLHTLRLEHENRVAHRWQWTWGIGAVLTVVMAVGIVKYLRRKHGCQMQAKDALLIEKESLLTEKQTLLQEIERKMYDMKIELGRLKGAISNQSKVVESLKKDRKKDREDYNKSVRDIEEILKEKEKEQKTERKAVQEKYRELNKRINQSEKEQNRYVGKVKELAEQIERYELLQRFLLNGGDMRAVLLVLELKSGQMNRLNTIRREEYAGLLKQLAEYAHPGVRQLIETDPVLRDKQELACLVSLGHHHDMEMLRMATNLKENSVKAYCTQVKAVLEKFVGKE